MLTRRRLMVIRSKICRPARGQTRSRRNVWHPVRLLVAAALGVSLARTAAAGRVDSFPIPPPDQAAQYRAEAAKSIVDLQQFRTSEAVTITTADGRSRTATLVNLNPFSNSWFLLSLTGARTYHLENPDPQDRQVRLAQAAPWGLIITDSSGTYRCDPWTGTPSALDMASASHAAFAPVCDGRLYMRNVVVGRRTNLERVAEFLRDNVWAGEAIVDHVRDGVFRDAFREEAALARSPDPGGVDGPRAPRPAALARAAADTAARPPNLGINVERAPSGSLLLGRWYAATGLPGVHVSVVQPSAIAPEILDSSRQSVNRLDPVEAGALDYLVAFNLSEFDLGFSLGTEHPRLGWSPRPPATARGDALPGPDGVGAAAPLVTTGMLDPTASERVIATFTGGFKREHGAFRYGPLATVNHGSHYGFIEAGVVFSKLQPGLATLYVLDDGSVHMATWTAADDRMLGRIRFARQNGVALIEPDPVTGVPAPGALVNKWGAGNWSGSSDESLRSLRAGACLQENGQQRFLIYGYFSTATPSAMARIFQAYGCTYAMHLDMNALEHTYLALYLRDGGRMAIEHLVAGMDEVDETVDGRRIPRFVGFADNRDFFYLTRRNTPQ